MAPFLLRRELLMNISQPKKKKTPHDCTSHDWKHKISELAYPKARRCCEIFLKFGGILKCIAKLAAPVLSLLGMCFLEYDKIAR